MLKYNINIKDLNHRTIGIIADSYELTESVNDYDKMIVTGYYSPHEYTVDRGDIVNASYNVNEYDDVNGVRTSTVSEAFEIINANDNIGYFQFEVDNFYSLNVERITFETDEDGRVFIYFVFKTTHYFIPTDYIKLYVKFPVDGVYVESEFICEFANNKALKWLYNDDFQYINDFLRDIFSNDFYVETDEVNDDAVTMESIPDNVDIYSPDYIRIPLSYSCDGEEIIYRYTYYKKIEGNGDISRISVKRDRIYFNNPTDKLIIDKKVHDTSIPINISQAFDTRLMQEDLIKTYFVNEELRGVINDSVDMEKFKFRPMIPFYNGNDEIERFEYVDKIKFNLHFRQHTGNDWTCPPDTMWNGVKWSEDLGYWVFDNNFFSYNTLDRSKQSDLLTFLDFSDTDVKYQKNKLKKSFIRLSFYDSTDAGRQNLLAYSTLFMDSGYIYSKYMKNVNRKGYRTVVPPYMNNLEGARVNTEPTFTFHNIPQYNEIEKLRLSSQIVVGDSFNSTSSSEGFYLYLWADSVNNIPSDIYMKVEFNHAGYGRIIPFMMPYFIYETENRNGIKSFNQILDDWNNGDGYGIRTYNKYSYIHLKCQYVEDLKKYIYYLDKDIYGKNSVNWNGSNDLELNLYEAKVAFTTETPENISPFVNPYNPDVSPLDPSDYNVINFNDLQRER